MHRLALVVGVVLGSVGVQAQSVAPLPPPEEVEGERCPTMGMSGMWQMEGGVSLRVADRHIELRRPETDAAPGFDRLFHDGGQAWTLDRLEADYGEAFKREADIGRMLAARGNFHCVLTVERASWRAVVVRAGLDQLVLLEAESGAVWRYSRGPVENRSSEPGGRTRLDLGFFSAIARGRR